MQLDEFENACLRRNVGAVCATAMSSGGPALDGLSFVFLIVCGMVLRALGPERTYGFEALMRWVCD